MNLMMRTVFVFVLGDCFVHGFFYTPLPLSLNKGVKIAQFERTIPEPKVAPHVFSVVRMTVTRGGLIAAFRFSPRAIQQLSEMFSASIEAKGRSS